ncbi:MAG: YciI family protein [Cyclobacteriaceae bacterium]|jgi:uncharacterized protein YciI|nr:YciI family protein [Cyclobacteriaceae bacterium]
MKMLVFLFFTLASSSDLAFAQPYTLVFLHKKTQPQELPKEKMEELMRGHMANMDRLAKEGKLKAAGPFDGGGGIFIFQSGSLDDVRAWVATDPGVQAQRWDIEIVPYQPQVGQLCVAPEPYQMVSYSFIRFQSNVSKSNVQQADGWMNAHRQYIKTLLHDQLITHVYLGDENDSVILAAGNWSAAQWTGDEAVNQGLLVPTFKTLWIARGSFCEK